MGVWGSTALSGKRGEGDSGLREDSRRGLVSTANNFFMFKLLIVAQRCGALLDCSKKG